MQWDAARRLDAPSGTLDACLPARGTSAGGASDPWVRETAFGTWFLGTAVWRHQVLHAALRDLQQMLPQRVRYPVVLDLGCGAGRALRLLDITFRPDLLLGVDVDRVQVAAAAPEARRCRAQVSVRVGATCGLPIPDRSVDMVFCHQTFHHLSDQVGTLREVYRVLRPGGTFLFAESCRRYIRSLPIRLFFRHPMQVQKTAAQYVALLRGEGFSIDAVSTPYPWWSRPDLGLLEWLGRPAGTPHEPTILNLVAERPT